jgi:tetratricopeptide (TPR) repeat protein
MSCSRWKALAFTPALVLLAAAPAVLAQEAATPAMSVCQARQTIVTELRRVDVQNSWKSPPSGVEFNVGELNFQAEPAHFKRVFPPGNFRIDLQTLGEVTAENGWIYVDGRNSIWGARKLETEENVRRNLSSASILGFLVWVSDDREHGDNNAAQAFATALNRLRLFARAHDSTNGLFPVCFADKDTKDAHAHFWAESQKKAAAWRSLAVKPAISDDVRRHRLLAESEIKEKQFDDALEEYEAALEIDPAWPEGHFNAALISAELGYHSEAIHHMRAYLELTPEAPDAQQARDQVVIWEAELKKAR